MVTEKWKDRRLVRDGTLLALKLGKGGELRNVGASRSGKRRGDGIPSEPPKGMQPCPQLGKEHVEVLTYRSLR